jgi:hypothetical protein
MAMFGALGKKRSQFDFSPIVYQTPGIGDGMQGNNPMGEPGLGGLAGPAPAPPTGPKHKGASVLGVIADALAGAAGQAGPYAAMVQQRRQQERQDEMYQRQRQDGMSDWLAKQAWERANPSPRAPHYWETNDGSLAMVGPDGKPSVLYKDPTPKTETIQVRDPATGEVKWYRVPQGGGDPAFSPSPGAASNRPAIGSVMPDPRKGGGAGNGAGGFRP